MKKKLFKISIAKHAIFIVIISAQYPANEPLGIARVYKKNKVWLSCLSDPGVKKNKTKPHVKVHFGPLSGRHFICISDIALDSEIEMKSKLIEVLRPRSQFFV